MVLHGEKSDAITASVEVCNTGAVAATETLQLYIRDLQASVVRPVKELKGFHKVHLQPGEKKKISFLIQEEMLRFTRENNTYGSEPGEFMLWIGDSSSTDNCVGFVLE